MNPPIWRVIPPLQTTGTQQMAVDCWLLGQHLEQGHPPTLRFYTWAPAAISLGHHQRQYPADWQDVTWQGQILDLVRRPTGGRAVLHQGDLTYTVVASLGDLVDPGDLSAPVTRQTSYGAICEFLIQGWRSLGVELQFGRSARNYIHQPNCFGTATSADLVLHDGTKLIGSAQLRSGAAILQHGSMRLAPDRQLFHQVFGPLPELAPPLQAFLSDLHSDPQVLITALTAAAEQCFGAQFQVQPLTPAEWRAIAADRGEPDVPVPPNL
jgi:lipoate---protein ligase